MFDSLSSFFSLGNVLILAIISLGVLLLVGNVKEERQIRALGARAPRFRSWLPFGLEFAYRGVRAGMQHKNYEFWQYLFSKYGNPASPFTMEEKIASQRFIFTADPELIKTILTTQFADYGKGKPFHEDWKDFLGDSIFTTDGEQWHKSRQLIRPQFIRDRVSDLEIFETHVAKLLNLMGGRGQEIDAAELFFRYTLDAATHFLLGKSVDSLDTPQADFAKAFSEVQRFQSVISRAGPFNWFLPRRTFRAGLEVIDSFINPYIENALRLSPEELKKKARSSGYTFLHALAGFTRDRKVLRDQIIAVLLAGRDTTAATLSWTFYELSRHPEIVQKLRREILERLGPDRPPTYDDLKNMRYLQQTMNEILRVYPTVAFNVRMSLHDTTLPHGGGPDGTQPIGIPKDTAIGYSPLVMQRRADLFPPPSPSFPDVATFYPDRWDSWTPKPWQYIPFNGGPRICVGQQFALTEMGYTITRILQRFEKVERFWEDSELVLKSDIVLQPGNGVRVGFWEAGKQI